MKTTTTTITCDFCGKDISDFVPFELEQELDIRENGNFFTAHFGLYFCDSTCFLNKIAQHFNKKV
jgi:hypothetical protein